MFCSCIFAVTFSNKLVCVVFRCSMLYIDFEGRSDGESIKRILSLVNPRNLVSVSDSSTRLPYPELSLQKGAYTTEDLFCGTGFPQRLKNCLV